MAHLARYWNIEHPLRDMPYADLTEKQKDSDRVWADKVLTIIEENKMLKPGPYVRGYCVKCRKTVTMEDPQITTLKNRRDAWQGYCPHCDTEVYRFTS